MNINKKEAYERALIFLHESLTTSGFLASTTNVDNYKRIWTRDGIITGLAALTTEDGDLHTGVKNTLNTISEYQGPHGEIPSNIDIERSSVSYGGLAGRVDAPLWYIIGVCTYALRMKDNDFAVKHKSNMDRSLYLAACWEFNNKDFIYAPASGDWADEYYFHGYTLLVQLLYFFTLRVYGLIFDDKKYLEKASRLESLIDVNYWIDKKNIKNSLTYHPNALEQILEKKGSISYWLPAFSPLGYTLRFDGFANSLILLSGIGDKEKTNSLVDYVKSLCNKLETWLIPGFYPQIRENDKEWDQLKANNKYAFKNYPDESHNGGLWPMVTGFWGAGLAFRGEIELAEKTLDAINKSNFLDTENGLWGFYEWHHGKTKEPMGTRHTTWSAAGAIILHQALYAKIFPFIKDL